MQYLDCNRAFHTQCLDTKEVPEGDWLCPECADDQEDDMPLGALLRKLTSNLRGAVLASQVSSVAAVKQVSSVVAARRVPPVALTVVIITVLALIVVLVTGAGKRKRKVFACCSLYSTFQIYYTSHTHTHTHIHIHTYTHTEEVQ